MLTIPEEEESVSTAKLAICVGVLLVGALQAFAQTRINVNITRNLGSETAPQSDMQKL